jgi:hypothetical protein
MPLNLKQKSYDAIIGFAYVFATEVSSQISVGASRTELTLVEGKQWKDIYFTPGSAMLKSQQSNAFAGRIIESKFEMKVPGSTPSLTQDMQALTERSVVIRLTMESTEAMICGGKSRKLRLSSSAAFGASNGYVLTFEYRSKTDFPWLLQEQSSGS